MHGSSPAAKGSAYSCGCGYHSVQSATLPAHNEITVIASTGRRAGLNIPPSPMAHAGFVISRHDLNPCPVAPPPESLFS